MKAPRKYSGLTNFVRGLIGHTIAGPVDYLGLYPARVDAQSADGKTVDLTVDDSRIGTASKVPLRLGIPGTTAKVSAGARCLLGWDGGDPSKRYAALWDDGATVTEITIRGTTVNLGSDAGTNFVALANLVDAELAKIETAHNTHVHVLTIAAAAGAGGTGTAAVPAVTYTPASTAAAQTKAI